MKRNRHEEFYNSIFEPLWEPGGIVRGNRLRERVGLMRRRKRMLAVVSLALEYDSSDEGPEVSRIRSTLDETVR